MFNNPSKVYFILRCIGNICSEDINCFTLLNTPSLEINISSTREFLAVLIYKTIERK